MTTSTALRAVAWAAWAAWTCKERQRFCNPGARRLVDREPPAGNCRGFFFCGPYVNAVASLRQVKSKSSVVNVDQFAIFEILGVVNPSGANVASFSFI